MELTEEKIQDEANNRQLEGVEPHSFYAGAMWAKKQIEKNETKGETLVIPDVVATLPIDPMVLAKYLHDSYEQIAKRTKWQTQDSCKVEFDELPIENKNTMILLAGKLILDFGGN